MLNATSNHLEDATIRGSFRALIFFDLFLSMEALPIYYCSPHNANAFPFPGLISHQMLYNGCIITSEMVSHTTLALRY